MGTSEGGPERPVAIADDLLRLRADRSDEALADLYARHGAIVFNVALRVTGDRMAAEEVTQIVFLDVWHRPERFDPSRGSLRTWLATAAHHRGVDWVRQEAARQGREHRYAQSGVTDPSDVEHIVAAALGAERIQAALAELRQEERTPICLAYFGGRSYRQVAQDLGIPEGTIKHRIRAGLRHLSTALAADRADLAF